MERSVLDILSTRLVSCGAGSSFGVSLMNWPALMQLMETYDLLAVLRPLRFKVSLAFCCLVN